IIPGGTIQPTASFTSNRTILMPTLTPILLVPAGVNWTVSGNFTSQTTAATPLKDGPGDLTLTGVNTFTGGYQSGISGPAVRGSLTAAGPNAGRTILSGPNGSMPLAASVLSLEGGEVVLDNSAAVNNNRIGSVTVGVIGGNVRLIGNAAAPVNEAVGALSINNANNQYGGTLTLVTPAGSGQSTTLTALNFTNQTAPNVGTLFVRGTNLGAASGDRTAVVFATNPAQTNGLIPAMVGATSETSEPTDFLTTTPAGTQFALTPFTAYTPSGTLTGTGGSATATYDVTTPVSGLAATSLANALRIRPGGSVDLNGSTMTLTTGDVLATGGANGGIANGTLSYGTGVPARFVVAAGSDLTVTAAINGTTGGLVKTGGGVLTLGGPVTMTTGLIGVGQGTLRYGVANALPTTSLVFVNAGATLDLNGTNSTIAGLNGYGTVNLGTGGTLTLNVGTAPALGLGGPFVGDATSTLVKAGTANQTVNGNSTGFAGAVNILNGTLTTNSNLGLGTGPIQLGDTAGANRAQLTLGATVSSFGNPITVPAGSSPTSPHTLTAPAGIATIASNIVINNTGSSATSGGFTATGVGLQLNGTSGPNGGNAIQTGTISGPGGIYLFSGNWTFNGNNTYSGGTFIDATTANAVGIGIDSTPTSGTVTSGPFGTGPVSFSTGFGSNLRADGGPRTIGNTIQLSATGGYFGVSGTNPLTLNGPIDFQGGTVQQAFYIMNTTGTTINGPIQNGSGGFAKNGPGGLLLTGNNTYSGTTTVNAGTLSVQNTAGSGTGSSSLVVNSGAILSGTGTVGDGSAVTVTVNSGGVVRPGAVTGIPLTVNSTGNVSFSPGSTEQVIVGSSGGLGGKLRVTGGGTMDLSGLSAAAPMNLFLTTFTGVSGHTPYSLVVMDSGSTPIVFPAGGFSPSLFSVTANFGTDAGFTVTNPAAGVIVVGFSPVPEPMGVLAVCAAAAGVAGWVRRRRG
ncbi:MAG TPA: autotransporter-associated beta strand repeat-containing protein, partial [Gemmataceae bacterium]